MDIEWIRKQLERPGKTQTGLAAAIGRSPSAVTLMLKGTRQIKLSEVPLIQAYFAKESAKKLNHTDMSVHPSRRAPEPDVDQFDLPKDVPVMGIAAGGTTADFFLNGTVIDYVRRPPGVSSASGVFAIYVSGTSMYPKFNDGDLVFASSTRTALVGDDVIVELYPTDGDSETPGFIKRLMKKTASKVVCEQFNPSKRVEFDLRRIKALHRVIPLHELLRS